MKRNIIVSFIAQIVVIVLFWFFSIQFIGILGDGASSAYYIYLAVSTILVLLFYMMAGYVFLKPAQTQKRSLISIFILSIVLFAISIGSLCFAFILEDEDFLFYASSIASMLNPIEYLALYINGALSFFVSEMQDKAFNVIIIFQFVLTPFIPSFFMWLGFKIENGKNVLSHDNMNESEVRHDDLNENETETAAETEVP